MMVSWLRRLRQSHCFSQQENSAILKDKKLDNKMMTISVRNIFMCCIRHLSVYFFIFLNCLFAVFNIVEMVFVGVPSC